MVQDINDTFALVRRVTFGIVIAFSFLSLALAGAIINYTETYLDGYFAFSALAIATAIFTFLTLPVSLFLSLNRKGAIVTMVAIEVGWTFFLWIMWLATGASAASPGWLNECNLFWFAPKGQAMCRETQALAAFSFLNFFILLGYNATFFVLVIRQHMRGNTNVWTGYVAETDYAAAGGNATHHEAKFADSPAIPSQYPPQNQIQQPYTQQPMSNHPQL